MDLGIVQKSSSFDFEYDLHIGKEVLGTAINIFNIQRLFL